MNVPSVNDQGQVISGTGVIGGTAASTTSQLANTFVTSPTAVETSATAAATSTTTSTASGIGNFGTCSVPEIKFGVGFDGRTETSFEPTDQSRFDLFLTSCNN